MTREEAIEFIHDIQTDAVYSILPEEKEALDMAISALSENKGEWIPIEERLPEIECEYWVTISKPYGTWVDRGLFIAEDKCFIKGSLILYDVTAWREDSEPYKAESEVAE